MLCVVPQCRFRRIPWRRPWWRDAMSCMMRRVIKRKEGYSFFFSWQKRKRERQERKEKKVKERMTKPLSGPFISTTEFQIPTVPWLAHTVGKYHNGIPTLCSCPDPSAGYPRSFSLVNDDSTPFPLNQKRSMKSGHSCLVVSWIKSGQKGCGIYGNARKRGFDRIPEYQIQQTSHGLL
jgi:hypothetical protein